MIHSMTAFASARGEFAPWSWSWELRSVNARGLDLRVRVPDWLEGLEAGVRADLGAAMARGSVTLGLRVQREDAVATLQVNAEVLGGVLAALEEVESQAMDRGITLALSCGTDILALRGVLEAGTSEDNVAPLVARLRADLKPVVADFLAMRAHEGQALEQVLAGQLDQIADLTEQAAQCAEDRRAAMAEAMRENLARVMEGAAEADPDRVAQELAMIAVKADVTEEIDRLTTHVTAARDLLAAGGAVGRKLDFMTQEFNREANTLCSKAQNRDLTAIGLELKAVIDQMREQVQNVE